MNPNRTWKNPRWWLLLPFVLGVCLPLALVLWWVPTPKWLLKLRDWTWNGR